ncbi:MAG TPA: sulfotransferase [Kiloniellaceae bacterium]
MAREEAWEQVGPAFRGEDRPILFVFGAARSGTTILNNLLYRHFSYGMGPEGTFVAEWAKRLPRYGDLGEEANLRRLVTEIAECRMLHIVRRKYRRNPFDVTPALILARLRERSYAGVVYAIFECMAELQGCTRLGNKNPDYGLQFPLLHRLFPSQARYLCIVRDGRDVALSILKIRWGLSSSYIAAKVWSDAMMALAAMQRQLGPDRLHVLSYENLLRRPQETLEGLRDFLGVPPEEAQIAAAVAELTQGRRAANFDKWKQQMSRQDLRLFEGVAGAMLERHGYALSGYPAEIR